MTRRRRRGGAAIEFALVAPVLLLMISGVVEYGRYTNQQLTVLHSVREGARMGSGLSDTWLEDEQDTAEMLAMSEQRVRDVLEEGGLDGDQADVTATIQTADGIDLIHVDVGVPYIPLVGLVPTPEQLHGELAMMVEEG